MLAAVRCAAQVDRDFALQRGRLEPRLALQPREVGGERHLRHAVVDAADPVADDEARLDQPERRRLAVAQRRERRVAHLGKPRHDVLNMIFTNMRARRDQEGDFNALIGACQVGERNLLSMLEKYGEKTVNTCINELLDMADRHMRDLIRTVPDGTYEGVAILEDAGSSFDEEPKSLDSAG